MKEKLFEKFASRKFLVAIASAATAFLTGNHAEAIYVVLTYIAGQSVIDATANFKEPKRY